MIKIFKIAVILVALFAYIFCESWYQLLDYEFSNKIAGISLAVFVVFLILALIFKRDALQRNPKTPQGKKWSRFIVIVIFLPLCGFAFLKGINGFFDASIQVCHNARVTGKHYSSGKSTWYYVRVQSWKYGRVKEEFRISRNFYQSVNPGSSIIRVCTKPGALGWEWVCGYGKTNS